MSPKLGVPKYVQPALRRPDKGGAVRQAYHSCVSLSLSIMRTLFRSSDEDPWKTVHVHPACPSPPIAGLHAELRYQFQKHKISITKIPVQQ